jgi:hypothetical protein
VSAAKAFSSNQTEKAASMNGYQTFVVLFAALVVVISLWSIIVVVRSPVLKLKPLWVIGCLFGFIGIGIDWTKPNDVVMLFGITIPMVMVFKVIATGQVIVKTGFPIVSVVALVKAGGNRSANGS